MNHGDMIKKGIQLFFLLEISIIRAIFLFTNFRDNFSHFQILETFENFGINFSADVNKCFRTVSILLKLRYIGDISRRNV